MKTVQIDGMKFKALLDENKLKYSVVSKELGYGAKYVSNCIGFNCIGMAAAQIMEIRYGIMLKDYIYVEPKPVEPPKPTEEPAVHTELVVDEKPAVVPLDMEQLQKAVALAMDNMKTDYEALRSAIREGIIDAVYAMLNDSDTRNAISGVLMNAHLSALDLNFKRIYSKKGDK